MPDRKLYKARTIRVVTADVVEAMIDLGRRGLHAQRKVRIAGIPPAGSPGVTTTARQNNAMHCMVVTLGGKPLLIECADPEGPDEWVTGRVFLDKRPPAVNHVAVCAVPGHGDRLDVGRFWAWLADRGFRDDEAKAVLNGTNAE